MPQIDPAYRKFVFTEETKTVHGFKVRRIRRIRDGKLGGFLQHEHNLSHLDNCWVDDDGVVMHDARVYQNGRVRDQAIVKTFARVSGEAEITGNAVISGQAHIYGRATVSDAAIVDGDCQAGGYCEIFGNARIYGMSSILGNAHIGGDVFIQAYAHIDQNALINGKAIIKNLSTPADRRHNNEPIIITGNAIINGSYFIPSGHYSSMTSLMLLQCGNMSMTLTPNVCAAYRDGFHDVYAAWDSNGYRFKDIIDRCREMIEEDEDYGEHQFDAIWSVFTRQANEIARSLWHSNAPRNPQKIRQRRIELT